MQAIEAAVGRGMAGLTADLSQSGRDRSRCPAILSELPAEIALRLLGRAVARSGDEGPVELGKLEALKYALDAAQTRRQGRFRRSLAGAHCDSWPTGTIIVERAPPAARQGLNQSADTSRASRCENTLE